MGNCLGWLFNAQDEREPLLVREESHDNIAPLLEEQEYTANIPPLLVRGRVWKTEEGLDGFELPNEYELTTTESDVAWYREFFVGRAHENWMSRDPLMVVSVITEQGVDGWKYRAVVRNAQAINTVLMADARDNSLSLEPLSGRDRLRAVLPRSANTASFRVCGNDGLVQELLMREERRFNRTYKIGVLSVRPGQLEEGDMFHNDHASASPQYHRFLSLLGDTIVLQGWTKYRAGLDVKENLSGLHSIYTVWPSSPSTVSASPSGRARGMELDAPVRNSNRPINGVPSGSVEVMFHVATLLPYTANDPQQIQRKRHIGNDMCMIVFLEPGAGPYEPSTVRSQVTHVIAAVTPVEVDGASFYRVAFARRDGVPVFGPALPAATAGAFEHVCVLPENELRDFLLCKVLNGERATYQAPAFSHALRRTRTLELEMAMTSFG